MRIQYLLKVDKAMKSTRYTVRYLYDTAAKAQSSSVVKYYMETSDVDMNLILNVNIDDDSISVLSHLRSKG